MSDFEDDDMDIDGPPSRSVQFTSNNTDAKGKRIVADLPVEAEDNLPWFVSLPQPIRRTFDR
jgi:replication factor C subunit 3/5